MSITTQAVFGPAEAPYLTRSVANSKETLKEQLAQCGRAALDGADASKPAIKSRVRAEVGPYRIEKRPALNFTLHYKEVKTVRRFLPASENGPAINFTLHLKTTRTVRRFLPAQEVKVPIKHGGSEDFEQQIKVEKET